MDILIIDVGRRLFQEGDILGNVGEQRNRFKKREGFSYNYNID